MTADQSLEQARLFAAAPHMRAMLDCLQPFLEQLPEQTPTVRRWREDLEDLQREIDTGIPAPQHHH